MGVILILKLLLGLFFFGFFWLFFFPSWQSRQDSFTLTEADGVGGLQEWGDELH